MTVEWNQALAAYDREYGLLKSLEGEYVAYFRQLFDAVAARCGDDVGTRVLYNATRADDLSLSLAPSGDTDGPAVDVKVWPAAFFGGEPGCLRVGIYVQRSSLGPAVSASRAVAVAREASSAFATSPVDGAPSDVVNAGDWECLRWSDLGLGAPDLIRQLVDRVRTALAAAAAARTAILAVREVEVGRTEGGV